MGAAWRRLRYCVTLGDVLAISLAYTLAARIRFGAGRIMWSGELGPTFPVLAAAIATVTFLLAWQFGLYRSAALFGGHRVYPKILTVATYGVVSAIMLSYFAGGTPLVSRLWLLCSWGFGVSLLSLNRLFWRRFALHWRARGDLRRRVIIAGANRHGIAVAQQLHAPHGEVEVLGFLDDYQRPGTEPVQGLRILGHPGSVLELAKTLNADEVIIIAGALAWDSQRHLAELVTRPDSPITAHISPTYYDLLTTSADLSHIAYVPVLTLHRSRLSGLNEFVKVWMDRGIAATMLLIAMPMFAYWWGQARRKKQPVFCKDRAFGLSGKEIAVLGVNPRLGGSPVFGRLPAFVNVLRGDLSLAGPRPVRGGEEHRFDRWLSNLFTMRPGLTGLWRFRAENLPIDEAVALDLYYIRNYTFAMDLQIYFNTARQLVRRVLGISDELSRWTTMHTPLEPPIPGRPVAAPDGLFAQPPVKRRSGDRQPQDAKKS